MNANAPVLGNSSLPARRLRSKSAGPIGARRGSLVMALDAPLAAAAASVGAAAIHFSVVANHFAESPAQGVFFAVVSWCQIGWAMVALRAWTRVILAAGLVGNFVVALVWLWSRTLGIPLGEIEPAAPMDVVATSLELAVVAIAAAGLVTGAWARLRDRFVISSRAAVIFVSTWLLAVALLTSAVIALDDHAAAEGSDGGHPTEAPAGH